MIDNGLILIVDDTPTNLEVLSETLYDAGFEVAIALDGESALAQVQVGDFDLILLDVMMPGIDGFETCRRLKADSVSNHIPIIFMTALSDNESKVKALEIGAVDYITKPFHEKEVLARVKTHLKLHKLTQSLEQKVAERTAQLTEALENLKTSQIQLVNNEKMSALGNLVAGVAHEINNPVGCISGNINHTEAYSKDLFKIINIYQQTCPQLPQHLQPELEALDLEFLHEDLPKTIHSIQLSIQRIKEISNSLRTFSRADSDYPILCNIHESIDSTILILKHRLKATENRPEIQIIKNYGNIPHIECYAGQLNQVFMNLLANAIDALEDSNTGRSFTQIAANPNYITITTKISDNKLIITIKDNGKGITENIKTRIFDQLFTTKEVGKGTGLGLAIARQVIVEKHRGTINVHSTPKGGAEFIITIPLS
ncbi:response regulator receiver sensor signal transduction histidine kinase [Rivularia sp. IAM M-261]|nr:response regulator receiver sensor signal transduction histidine kinase [Rivularia sp. IAM M-261]